MTGEETLVDLFGFLANNLRETIGDLSIESLSWQPDREGNNIAVTAWHIGRLLDYLSTCVLQNCSADAEVWQTGNWCAHTGYDPRGIGWNNTGTLIGYTRSEVEDVPILPAAELLAYVDEATEAVSAAIRGFPADEYHDVAPGFPEGPWAAWEWIRICLINSFEHLGEIKAFIATQERQAAEAQSHCEGVEGAIPGIGSPAWHPMC